MSSPLFRVERLAGHDRQAFRCGVEALDRYLAQQVGQDVRRRIAACFVAIDPSNDYVVGYYTLSAADIPLASFPEKIMRRLPRYPSVPVARIGRLAVDQRYHGRGLGAALLLDAADRASTSEVAVFGLVVDSKSDEASAFYRHIGFTTIPGADRQLAIPIATLRSALG